MSSSFYSPRYGCWVVFPGFFSFQNSVFCVFTVWRSSVWIRQVAHSCRAFLCTWLRTCVSWATSEQFVKPVKLLLVRQDFRATSVAKLPLFCLCFGLGFFPSYKKFFLMFGINATRYKRGSDNRQALLCLFIKSTSSSFTFTFCITEYFYFFFCLAFLQILFLPNSISTTCTILHELLALQLVVLSCTSERSPEHMGVRCLCSRAELCAWHHVQAGSWLWVLQQWRNNSAFYCV